MSEHKGATDKTHVIQLESEILTARWKVKEVTAGGVAMFEVLTRYVGNGAEAHLEFKTGSKKVGEQDTHVISDQCDGVFEVPGDAKGDLSFEIQLKKHKLKAKSDSIPVQPAYRVKNARWDRKEARRGDTVKLLADVEGCRDGTRVPIQIYEEYDDGTRDLITSIEGETQGKSLEARWDYEYHEDTHDIPTHEEAEKGYVPPKYVFELDAAGMKVESGVLGFRDWVDLSLTLGGTRPAADEEYVLTLPDGKERKGKLDDQGKAREKDVPPGDFKVRFPRLQGDSQP